MGCLAVHGRLGRAALLIIEGRTSEFGSSVMSHSLGESRVRLSLSCASVPSARGALIAAPMGPRGGLNGADRLR